MTDLRQAAQQLLEACEQRLPLNGQATIIDELNNLRTALEQQQAEPVQGPFDDLAPELFVVAQRSPADDGFSDTIDRIESWLREHFSTPPQRKPLPKGEWPKHKSPYVKDEYIGYAQSDLDDYAMQVLAAHGIKEGA